MSGIELVAEAVGLADACAEADLVITGEGKFDWQSLHGKVASGVLTAAGDAPVVVLAGTVDVESPVPAYSLIDEVGRERAFAEPAAALAELAGAIAQVSRRAEPAVSDWRPPRRRRGRAAVGARSAAPQRGPRPAQVARRLQHRIGFGVLPPPSITTTVVWSGSGLTRSPASPAGHSGTGTQPCHCTNCSIRRTPPWPWSYCPFCQELRHRALRCTLKGMWRNQPRRDPVGPGQESVDYRPSALVPSDELVTVFHAGHMPPTATAPGACSRHPTPRRTISRHRRGLDLSVRSGPPHRL